MERVREIKVRVYIDTNKRTIDKEYEPRAYSGGLENDGESLSDLLRRLADEYEDWLS
jgi:hypothetical protein